MTTSSSSSALWCEYCDTRFEHDSTLMFNPTSTRLFHEECANDLRASSDGRLGEEDFIRVRPSSVTSEQLYEKTLIKARVSKLKNKRRELADECEELRLRNSLLRAQIAKKEKRLSALSLRIQHHTEVQARARSSSKHDTKEEQFTRYEHEDRSRDGDDEGVAERSHRRRERKNEKNQLPSSDCWNAPARWQIQQERWSLQIKRALRIAESAPSESTSSLRAALRRLTAIKSGLPLTERTFLSFLIAYGYAADGAAAKVVWDAIVGAADDDGESEADRDESSPLSCAWERAASAWNTVTRSSSCGGSRRVQAAAKRFRINYSDVDDCVTTMSGSAIVPMEDGECSENDDEEDEENLAIRFRETFQNFISGES